MKFTSVPVLSTLLLTTLVTSTPVPENEKRQYPGWAGYFGYPGYPRGSPYVQIYSYDTTQTSTLTSSIPTLTKPATTTITLPAFNFPFFSQSATTVTVSYITTLYSESVYTTTTTQKGAVTVAFPL